MLLGTSNFPETLLSFPELTSPLQRHKLNSVWTHSISIVQFSWITLIISQQQQQQQGTIERNQIDPRHSLGGGLQECNEGVIWKKWELNIKSGTLSLEKEQHFDSQVLLTCYWLELSNNGRSYH